MQFGILLTSQPNPDEEPYPHHATHDRVTEQVVLADALGFDTAWIAEHHFSDQYGIMPDCYPYIAYLANLTKRIRFGTGVVVLPAYNPVRAVETAAFIDVLTKGRLDLALGSGYRKYEFEGLGYDFDSRRERQEEALDVMLELFHAGRIDHEGRHYRFKIEAPHQVWPKSIQQPHPPLYLGVNTDQSAAYAGRHGFGLMMTTLPTVAEIRDKIAFYRRELESAPAQLRRNPALGKTTATRWVYVGETAAKARAESEPGLMRQLQHFAGGLHPTGKKVEAADFSYDKLVGETILHGSPAQLVEQIERLRDEAGIGSVLLHYPPYYGAERTKDMLRRFAAEVMPKFKGAAEAA
jgi:alkanesulfonate monooxygenase SsuD/methylene tetrahydromethanopterin reductase-like flavin-dependent oxidoreductase (luciferase family)